MVATDKTSLLSHTVRETRDAHKGGVWYSTLAPYATRYLCNTTVTSILLADWRPRMELQREKACYRYAVGLQSDKICRKAEASSRMSVTETLQAVVFQTESPVKEEITLLWCRFNRRDSQNVEH